MIDVKAYFDTATHTVTYLVWDKATSKAVIIDPVLDYEPHAANLSTDSIDNLLQDAKALQLDLMWILETHAHADHLSAGDYVRDKTGAKIGIGARITEVQKIFLPIFKSNDVSPDGHVFDQLFEDGDILHFGDTEIRVIHTPGHTPACVTYLIGDYAFVGDTLFMPDYGTARADFPGGDAGTLYRSIQKILDLPEWTQIMTGHDYLPETRSEFAWQCTVAEQRAKNIHVHSGITEDAFIKLRKMRDATLSAPRLILPSLQVNIRAGALPPADETGQHYLTIPVNRI